MITYTIHKEHRLVVTTLSGTIEDAAVIAYYRKLYALPDWHPGMNELSDVRNADVSQVSADAMRLLGRMAEDAHADAVCTPRTAALIGSDLQYGMARMYEQLTAEAPADVQTFREVTLALLWLGLPEDLYS